MEETYLLVSQPLIKYFKEVKKVKRSVVLSLVVLTVLVLSATVCAESPAVWGGEQVKKKIWVVQRLQLPWQRTHPLKHFV